MNKAQLQAFHEGRSLEAYQFLGAHKKTINNQTGYEFSVYAPHAQQVELIGSFNQWIGSKHPMKRVHHDFFTLFVPGITDYESYKYHIQTASGEWIDKADPYGFFAELRPYTASQTFDLSDFPWTDETHLASRTKLFNKPMQIYEVHLGSWRQKSDGSFYSYEELAQELIPYVLQQGFTHIELMPILENPLDLSWGYLATGYFSATSRYGNPKQLMHFIDQCHRHQLGVILDFIPVHFIKDAHGLHMFDGEPLYEYGDEYRRYSQWGSVNFNLFSEQVRSFLMSSAAFWLKEFHIDGIRYDAVSNLIFYNGNPNDGVNEGAGDFIRRNNYLLAEQFPNVFLIAEDSSSHPGVTTPTFDGGLGFDYKWDLGWMNDTLRYYQIDPIHRKHHHNQITFSMHYFWTERFLMPLSHDEVVHGKGSIVNKMWGNFDDKFAQVRNLYTYMFTHPGKTLFFMGNELGTFDEWSEATSLNWRLLEYSVHFGVQRLVRDLNETVKFKPALYAGDYDYSAFKWLMVQNAEQSILAYSREFFDSKIVVLLNMTPVDYKEFELGVPWDGKYHEVLNSDKKEYGGGNRFNYDNVYTRFKQTNDQPHTITVRLAPFAAIIYEVVNDETLKQLP